MGQRTYLLRGWTKQVWEESIEMAVKKKRVLLLNNVDPLVHSADLEVGPSSLILIGQGRQTCFSYLCLLKPSIL